MREFQDEFALMKAIGRHDHIIAMVGCSTLEQPLCIVLEYASDGDLLHYLRKHRKDLGLYELN